MLTNLREILVNLTTGFLAVILVILPREYVKAYTITKLGDQTPKKLGRLSLNPFVHLDPIGTISFILFNFGWSRPVPTIPLKSSKLKKSLLITSIIGPVFGIILFVIYGIITRNIDNRYLFLIFYKATKWSLTYAIFSMLPIPPLDGSRFLSAFLPGEYIEWYVKYEVYGILFMLALLFIWILPLVMSPFVAFIENLTNFIINGGG
ncbi:Zn-dependent protease (includes SpoIVFB) [Thermosipho atlanticus DSM 15807]|uniref:Zn-dependent protease (Includes SpoIVFB) n=1 Tax=Thermosipho atlanticus DSM 15807 TaxID=1123380 RepID=A0A1M5QY85_9BACT|nr:Zn-dependent protease (includes SpoIVFB) [Thermosipho atlanticus DSM 15807]